MPYVTSIERLAREEGKEEGHKEGHKEGKEEGLREALLAALEERFGAVPAAVEQAVLAVTDPGLLSQLLRQAVKVPTLEALEAMLRERDRSPDR